MAGETGTRVSRRGGAPDTASYSYNPANKGPQLVGITHTNGERATSYTYDSNGNLISETAGSVTKTYTWDQDDKMTGLSGGLDSASYTYAYNGDRLRRTLNSTTWNYLYSKEDILKVDQGGANPMYLTQGPGIDDVLAETVDVTTNYAYKNMLSSVMQLASNGTIATNYTYDAWGEATNWPTPATDTNPYGYTGREWEYTNSYYYRNRMYGLSAGKFLSTIQ